MTETLKPFLSLTREEIIGTVNEDMSYGVPLIDQMDDEELAGYLLGEIEKATLGLPGSQFISGDEIIAENLKGLRERTKFSLRIDVQYAVERERPIPLEVIIFLED